VPIFHFLQIFNCHHNVYSCAKFVFEKFIS
jgi:hypothetical protein